MRMSLAHLFKFFYHGSQNKTQLYAKYKRHLKQRFRKAQTKGTEKVIQANRNSKRKPYIQDIMKRKIQAEKH